ncbi:MAG TPA: HEAT repeat domain-containing protein [Bryobacteraceae bacterium]|nr:HEAT repeat domain-containing protein [Bryobacteraceae bacterium]
MKILTSTVVVMAFFGSAEAADDLRTKADAILGEALASKNPDTRKQAVAALSLAGAREPYASRLINALQDGDVEVRLAAVSSLSEVKSSASRAALRKALEDEVPEVSFAAAKALWALRDPAGRRALMAVLEGENKTSSSFLSRQKREALRMMHTPRTALLFAARQGAGFAPIPGLGGGISSMQSILTDPAVSGRAAAALLLCQQNDPGTLQALTDALQEKDASLRASAVHCLALKNSAVLQKQMATLLADEKEPVRLRAASAYVRLSAPRSVPAPAAAKP